MAAHSTSEGDPAHVPNSIPPAHSGFCLRRITAYLATCALTLLFALPSHAGQWQITYSGNTTTPNGSTGTYTFSDNLVTGPSPYPKPAPFGPTYHPQLALDSGRCMLTWLSDGAISMTVTAKLTWMAYGPADLPPAAVDVLETGDAGSGVGLRNQTSVTTTASDGLGDDPTYPTPTYYGAQCHGKHLYHLTVPTGQTWVTLPTRSLGASLSWMPAGANVGAPGMSVSYGVQLDTRAVAIWCPAVDTNFNGGSKYRDPALTGPVITNLRKADGSLRGDTVLYPDHHPDQIAGTPQLFLYKGIYSGSWDASQTTYHWNASLSGDSLPGSLPGIQDFSVPVVYTNPGHPVTTNNNAKDHIYLSLYQATAQGPIKAAANYDTHFHDEYEPNSWPEDSGSPYKVMGPDPDVPSWPTYAWKMVTPVIPATYQTTSVPVTYKEAGIDSVEGGLDIGIEPVTLHFAASGTPTSEVSASQNMIPKPALQQGEKTWVVYRQIIARHKGHLDHYGVHGYISTGIWRHDVAQGIDLDFYFPRVSASTLSTDPPAGWNPPGYN